MSSLIPKIPVLPSHGSLAIFWKFSGEENSKSSKSKIASRIVTLEYELLETKVQITITDKGKGFDFIHYLNNDIQNITGYSGRGILMTKCFIDAIHYREPGNQVTIEVSYDESNIKLPLGLEEHKILELSVGEVLFQKGDKSDGL